MTDNHQKIIRNFKI